MNENIKEPQDAKMGQSQMKAEKIRKRREISNEELKDICDKHDRWLAGSSKEGRKANLHGKNLSGKDLSRRNLAGAVLSSTTLNGTNFIHANLQNTTFVLANMSGANLRDADLRSANLSGIRGLDKAILNDCIMEDAIGLKGSDFARADVTGARLPDDIKEFKTLDSVEEISKNARKIFLAMLLGCAYSWLTIFSTGDVNLLTNSSSSPLPIIRTAIPLASFYYIAPIILIGSYLYLHFYLQRLWRGLAELPAILEDGKPLYDRAYPWLLNSLVRRHFEKLQGEKVEPLPEFDENDNLIEISDFKWFVKKCATHLLHGRRPFISILEEWVSIALAWWVVPVTIFGFWIRYLPRHDWTGTSLHIILIIFSLLVGIFFYRVHARTLRGDRFIDSNLDELLTTAYRNASKYAPVILAGILLILLSYGAIDGVTERSERFPLNQYSFLRVGVPKLFKFFGYDVFADFGEKTVSSRPEDYWIINPEERENAVSGANLAKADLRHADAFMAFLDKADLREARLDAVDLRGAKLRYAKLWGANLQWAYLWDANLERANLKWADLSYAYMLSANIKHAVLDSAIIRGAELPAAHMDSSVIRRANLDSTVLRSASLNGCNLYDASLYGADLTSASLQGANLIKADMQKARLVLAKLQGANLTGANLQEAEMTFAGLQGANLMDTDLQGANFSMAKLHKADLSSANLKNAKDLTIEQLDEACGDSLTILPDYLQDYRMKPCPCGEDSSK